jgi:chromosome segregation ATPase
MNHRQPYEDLLGTLQQVKDEILKQMKPLEEQIIYASVEDLKKSFAGKTAKLSQCMEEIDKNLFNCQQHVKECDAIRSSLHELNERIAQFGSERMPIADGLANLDLAEIIRERIEYLKSQGKI